MARRRVMIGIAVVAGALVAVAIQGWLAGGRRPNKIGETEPRGPHGGRLLVAEDLALEVIVAWEGVSPQLRMYPITFDARPIPPSEVQLTATLERSNGSTGRITFVAEADFLKSTSLIAEPNSFIVRMTVTYRGLSHSFRYEHSEGGETQSSTKPRRESVGRGRSHWPQRTGSIKPVDRSHHASILSPGPSAKCRVFVCRPGPWSWICSGQI